MPSQERSASWFLAQVKPNCSNIADKNLKRQGFETFLPLEEKTQRKRDKFVTALQPLFPGYIFVAFDTAKGLWHAVNSTYGIARLVSFGKEPASVPRDIVSQLMRGCDADGKVLPAKRFQSGDQVVLTSGPFTDFIAEVEKVDADKRVWVLMEAMGQQTRVAVGGKQLKAL